jgi:peptidoglycan/LPS O-acetylase OafA/YrhL
MRGISIALVLLSHLLIYRTPSPAEPLMAGGLASGATGVTVFFVLSGYLITTLLLAEERERGRIGLRGFYARRALRIFPAYYAYLAVVVALTLAAVVPRAPLHDFAASAVYLRNFVGRGHETAHLWSLAVEEHFYLLWPSFLILVPPRRRLPATLGLIAAVVAWRTALVLTDSVGPGPLHVRTDLRVDSILAGCTLALLLARRGSAPLFRHSGPAALAAAAALAAWAVGYPRIPHAEAVGTTGTALLIALVLHHVVAAPSGAMVRALSVAPLRAVGKLSYSLYLWQQLFLGTALVAGIGGVRWFPLDLALTVLAALASYALVERPFLRLKDRFSRRAHAAPEPRAMGRGMSTAGEAA